MAELNRECDAFLKDPACEDTILSACDSLDVARPSVVPFLLGRGVTMLLKSLKALDCDGKIPDLLRISDALEAAIPGKSSEMAR